MYGFVLVFGATLFMALASTILACIAEEPERR